MSNNRYNVLKVFQPKEWFAQCPVKVEKGQLLLDNQQNKILLQLKLFNLNEKVIRAVYIDITCFDDAMDYVNQYNDIAYQRLSVLPHMSFGDRQANYLEESNISNVKIVISKVVYENNEVWRNDKKEIGILLPEPKLLNVNDELYEQIIREFEGKNVKPKFWFEDNEEYWRCTCGQANLKDSIKCCYCKLEKNWLEYHIDKEHLNKELNKYNKIKALSMQKETELRKNEEAEYALEKSRKTKKKKKIMLTIIFSLIILLVFSRLYIGTKGDTSIPLTQLVEDGNENKIEEVLRLGKDINEVDEYGETALYTAVSNSDEEMVKFLINKGANTNYTDLLGCSVLENAIYRKNENIVRCLVENKADVNFIDKKGNGMVEVANSIGENNIALYLMENGAKEKVDKISSNIDNTNEETVKIPNIESECKLSDTDIWVYTQYVVKNNLKSPKSADFPTIDDVEITKKYDSIVVKSYVDAKNSFGADIRSNFIVTLSADGQRAIDVKIE